MGFPERLDAIFLTEGERERQAESSEGKSEKEREGWKREREKLERFIFPRIILWVHSDLSSYNSLPNYYWIG